jgi:myo-inositol-1-phosphate synthase
MTTPQVKEVNAETGEEILRDMNTAELVQLAKDVAEREAIEAAEANAEAKKASAQAKLEALGLTADDLKALGL